MTVQFKITSPRLETPQQLENGATSHQNRQQCHTSVIINMNKNKYIHTHKQIHMCVYICILYTHKSPMP